VAIAWVLSRSPRVVTIPGMKTRRHLQDNLAGSQLMLTAGQLQRIDALLAQSPVVGERHPPAMMQIIDHD
jgi:aryl-alcohol dehydrogenase-like predicted oxidoreductase